MRRNTNRHEFRDYPYRPHRESDDRRGAFKLILRFAYRYLWPHKWQVLLCVVLVSLNACSVYLQSYYGRIVVDEILMVSVDGIGDGGSSTGGTITVQGVDRDQRMPQGERERNLAVSGEEGRFAAEVRPPWAGRRLFVIFVVYLATVIGLNLADRATQVTRSKVGTAITERLREDIHSKILGLSTSYHQRYTPGRLMSRILSDVSVVQEQLMELIIQATSQVLMFIIGVTILFVLSPAIALVVLIAMIPYMLIVSRMRFSIRRVNRELRHTNACLWGLVSQKLDAMKAICSYGRERIEYLNFHRLSSVFLRDTIAQQRLAATMNRTADAISAITVRGILIAGALMVIGGSMTLGKMLYIYGTAANLFVPVVVITQLVLLVSNLLVVLHRLAQTFETSSDVEEDENAVAFPLPLRYGFSLKNITFFWSDEGKPILDDISLEIPAGRWLCIMGASGSGKTTLLQLLARLFDPQEGTIEADGVALDTIKFNELRRHMAMVPQEAQILSGTVRDNITYGRNWATPSEIMTAAKAADCHNFVMRLQVQYETVIGEKGTTLSGGQRQRISIARALLTNPDVLLLDDCTSALDADTERKLQGTLSELMVNKTAVIVSQRVSMALRCHNVIVLDHGRIIESGTPKELLAAGGYFADLHRQQTE